MNAAIETALSQALQTLQQAGTLPADWINRSQLTRTKDRAHGDFASNVAMMAAKAAGRNPRELAQQIIDALPPSGDIARAELAGPGFINFFLNDSQRFAVLQQIEAEKEQYGRSRQHAGQRVQVEFVSANPTSSLHVGHGRGAAYGMSVANLLEAVGYTVDREYYVNDAGRQMDILATSSYLRYLECCGEQLPHFPVNGYRGDYVRTDIAEHLFQRYSSQYVRPVTSLFDQLPEDEVSEIDATGEKVVLRGDKEKHIDGLIANARQLLGADYAIFHQAALNIILDDIRADLADFGVRFDRWFSEATLKDRIDEALARLQAQGHLYEQDGNLWFRSTDFGDEKDRVVRRANGQTTYFAADIAYHLDKLQRGYDQIVDIWGADHHGYIARVRGAIAAMGFDPARMIVKLVQFVSLWRGDQQVQMSSRSGQFVSLRDLRDEVGNDATRYYYVMRKSEQHIDFDLELAKSQSKDNPVYYVQYAHARVSRVMDKLQELGRHYQPQQAQAAQHLLTSETEAALLARLAAYPEVVQRAAQDYEPHQVTNYLKELAQLFHGWYDTHRIISDEDDLTQARLRLSLAVRQVIANALRLLDVCAPERM